MTTPTRPPEPPYDTGDREDDDLLSGVRTDDDQNKNRTRAILPILGVVVFLAVKVGLLGLIFSGSGSGSSSETGEQGYWHLYFPSERATSMTLGAPVVADGHRIGEITAVQAYEGKTAIGFHITTSYNSVVQSEPGFAVGPIGNRHLCFGTQTECGKGSPAPPVTQLDPPAEAPVQ